MGAKLHLAVSSTILSFKGNPKKMPPGNFHVPELRENSVKYGEGVGNTLRPNWEGETTHLPLLSVLGDSAIFLPHYPD